MPDEPFGRQPKPVHLTFDGDPRDIAEIMSRIKNIIERGSYDIVTRNGPNALIIHPHAVND
jgi:hypothetical protein